MKRPDTTSTKSTTANALSENWTSRSCNHPSIILKVVCLAKYLLTILELNKYCMSGLEVEIRNYKFVFKYLRPHKRNREFKKWRRQRPWQRHESMIWLVEWRKIIVLHVRHAFWCNFFYVVCQTRDEKFSFLRFWGLFLKSPETFRVYFGCRNSLYIFATPRF